jgi:hypothetical protein
LLSRVVAPPEHCQLRMQARPGWCSVLPASVGGGA